MTPSNSSDHSAGPLDTILPILQASQVEVLDLECGYVTCPGIETHTTPNAKHDCIAYNNEGIPFLHCLHQSCRVACKDANTKLRKLAFGNRFGTKQPNDTAARERREARSVRRAQAERERKLAAAVHRPSKSPAGEDHFRRLDGEPRTDAMLAVTACKKRSRLEWFSSRTRSVMPVSEMMISPMR